MRGNVVGLFLISIVILLTVYGQISIKMRISQMPPLSISTRHPLLLLLQLLVDPIILSGLLAAFFAAVAWMFVLKRLEFGFAYPFMSLNFPIAILVSSWLLHESVSSQRLWGIAIIVIGTILAARG